MASRNNYDVLIVGAGPAGSFAAERLACGGARVALFDGRPVDDAKACGGGVTSKALKAWPFLAEAAGRIVDEVKIYAPSGEHVLLKLKDPFAIYSRRTFDAFLLERAQRSGAEVFSGRVKASNEKSEKDEWLVRSRDGRAWKGKFLVAADGANSPIARCLAGPLANSEMEVAFGYRAPMLAVADASPTIIAFLPGWSGYAWAFPRLDHISFGIATTQDAFDHAALDRLLWSFMFDYYGLRRSEDRTSWATKQSADVYEETREMKELRASAERYAARIPGLAPETFDKRRATGDGWALVGDAAGFADPVTGEGIYYALRSAEIFAKAYLAGQPLDYERMWREDFGRELRRASKMRRRFYGNFWGGPFTERMVSFARVHRGIRETLCELIAGEQGYTDLKPTLARRAFRPL